MNLEQIQQLMKRLEESRLHKLKVKQGDFELLLEKEGSITYAAPAPAPRPAAEMPLVPKGGHASKGEAPAGTFVTSPMVGTFYATPAPDQPPFVKVGDKVTPQTVVAIIEAMKVMNEVKAGVSGVIAEALLESGQPVEFGTRLFRIAT